MTLSRLLEEIAVIKMFQTMFGQMVVTHEIEVPHIQYDSRKVQRGDMFVALRGVGHDGHQFIDDAVRRGAKVVVVDNDEARPDSFFMHAGVVKVVVPNTRQALAGMSGNYFGHPSKKLRLVGVTGTNGKTTTTYLLAALLEKAGLIGTIEYRLGDQVIAATHTTPESLELNGLLARMIENGLNAAVMEVSSHALHQHRVAGMRFVAGVFTNLTQDHLDYHGSMEEYFRAKKILFDNLDSDAVVVTNADDAYSAQIAKSSRARHISYGVNNAADVRGKNVVLSIAKTAFTVTHAGKDTTITSHLIGRFNVYNILAAFATGVALGIPRDGLRAAIAAFRPVRGRFERIAMPKGFTVIIDYAHTPDALQNCMKAIHDIFYTLSGDRGRIITVFGCGGNRDRGKRPIMGRIATELGDLSIVTSDNPRFEDPEAIIDEVVKGAMPGRIFYREADRRKAIKQALDMANPGDVVLIAGKGHEMYQVVGDRRLHFSDREVVEEYVGT